MRKRISVFITLISFFIASCNTVVPTNTASVGPDLPRTSAPNEAMAALPRLDIAIPIFDPNIPADSEEWVKQNIWPELRRAEANYFATKLKKALEATNQFGAVRVTPTSEATADYYVLGRIKKSNGAVIRLDITTTDISNRTRLKKAFRHKVPQNYYDIYRNQGQDPYDPIFEQIAEAIVEDIRKYDLLKRNQIKEITNLRFAQSFHPAYFSEFLQTKNRRISLVRLPAKQDPMMQRIAALRIRDQLFIDDMQTHYQTFSDKMGASYRIWQEQAMREDIARKALKRKAVMQGILGVLVLGAVVAALAASNNSSDATTQTLGEIGAVAGAVGGAALIYNSFKTNQATKIHSENLEELGKSLDLELAPTVIQMEEETEKISGNASEQFDQWRQLLKRIYEMEKTPDINL